MKRIELLKLTLETLESGFSLPASVFAENPNDLEWTLSKIISMGVFTIQLNHAIKTFGEQSKKACAISEEEEKFFLPTKDILIKKDISLEFLAKLKEQLSNYITGLTKDLSPQSSITMQLKLLMSNFLDKENILNKNFLNSIEEHERLRALLISAFGMLLAEIPLEARYDDDPLYRLLLNAIRDPNFYDNRQALSLYEIAMKMSEFDGAITEFAFGVPQQLEKFIRDHKRKIFSQGVRVHLITLDKLPGLINERIISLSILAQNQPYPADIIQSISLLAQEILIEAKKFQESPEIKIAESSSNFILKIILLYQNVKISKWEDFLNKKLPAQDQDQKFIKMHSPRPPASNRPEHPLAIISPSSNSDSKVQLHPKPLPPIPGSSSAVIIDSSSSSLASNSSASAESQTSSVVSSASAPSIAASPLVSLPVSGDLSSSVSASSASSNSELQSSISESSASSEKLDSLEQSSEDKAVIKVKVDALQDQDQAPKSLSLNPPSSASSSASLIAQPAASPLSSQPPLPKPIVQGSKLQQRLSIFENNKESESPQPQKQDPKRRQGSLFSAERLAAASSGIKVPSLGGGN